VVDVVRTMLDRGGGWMDNRAVGWVFNHRPQMPDPRGLKRPCGASRAGRVR
jgi:hypothetical protein